METLENLNQSLKELKEKQAEVIEKRKQTYERITGIAAKQWLIIDDNFITVECENIEQLGKALNKLQPYKNGWRITDGIYITSLYKLIIDNGYYNRYFKIEIENKTGLVYWFKINFNNLPVELKEKYFVKTTRKLYDTETVYVNLPAHYKKFKDIRITSYSFKEERVNWYGGDQTLINETEIKEIINDIKNI